MPQNPNAAPGPRSDSTDTLTLQLHAEDISVTKRRLLQQRVRVATETRTRDVLVDEPLTHEKVVVEHVSVGRYVDAVPDIRQEGDLMILPVVEEEIVVTRRLFLREEVHVRRTQISTNHVETVTLRVQKAVVTREAVEPGEAYLIANAGAAETELPQSNRTSTMEQETIVAVYDTPAHAELAAADLREAGIAESSISLHSGTSTASTTSATPVREEGFWASLFGGEPAHDTAVYDRSLANGSTVVTVTAPETQVARVMEILESHKPIDIDERAASYGLSTSTAMSAPGTPALQTGPAPEDRLATGYTGTGSTLSGTAARTDDTGVIQLAEEAIAVGKRVINRGGTRIRRYVVETPVEENVSLRSEKVILERHPVTDGRPVMDASFSEKVIEMTETAEEAVVSKTARVVEEVGLRKEATDRVETIHDTVRKEEVEIEKIPGSTAVPETYTTPKV
jgi:uncharacterized protein (TIGR02271 family)